MTSTTEPPPVTNPNAPPTDAEIEWLYYHAKHEAPAMPAKVREITVRVARELTRYRMLAMHEEVRSPDGIAWYVRLTGDAKRGYDLEWRERETITQQRIGSAVAAAAMFGALVARLSAEPTE